MTQKVLVMIVGDKMSSQYSPHIRVIHDLFSKTFSADYACISSYDDFQEYGEILPIKYKSINPKWQLDKVCDFLSTCPEKYDWYVKIRPEVLLSELPDILSLSTDAIHARARGYNGPKRILFGCSVGGNGGWSRFSKDTIYSENETHLYLDDHMYIFHRNVVDMGAFAILTPDINPYLLFDYNIKQDENIHNGAWKHRGIKRNPIRIHLTFKKIDENGGVIFSAESGHVNI